MTLHLPQSGG